MFKIIYCRFTDAPISFTTFLALKKRLAIFTECEFKIFIKKGKKKTFFMEYC